MIYETVYKGRDNSNDLVLKADGAVVDLSGVTKMELIFSGQDPVSSTTSPAVFDWSQGNGKLVLTLGDITFLSVGSEYVPELIVYDASNPDGVNWGKIAFTVN